MTNEELRKTQTVEIIADGVRTKTALGDSWEGCRVIYHGDKPFLFDEDDNDEEIIRVQRDFINDLIKHPDQDIADLDLECGFLNFLLTTNEWRRDK